MGKIAEVTTEQAKLIEIGKQVGANVIVGGTISSSENEFALELTLYDVATGTKMGDITSSTTEGFGGVMKTVLADAAKQIAKKL